MAKQTTVGHLVYVCMIMDLINARRTYFTHFAIAGLTYSQLKNKVKVLTPRRIHSIKYHQRAFRLVLVHKLGGLGLIELMINKLHGLLPSGGLVSPSGGFASLLFDQVGHFASIELCLALSHHTVIQDEDYTAVILI